MRTGKPVRLSRRRFEQSRIRSNQRCEFGALEAAIVVEDGPTTTLGNLEPLLEREDVVAALAPVRPKATDPETTEASQQLAEERDVVHGEPPEDDLIEAIAAEPPPSGQVDVARLWELRLTLSGSWRPTGRSQRTALSTGISTATRSNSTC